MNTLDDLRSSLDAYADRGDERGADAVWASATVGDLHATTDPAPRRRPTPALALAVAAVVVLLVGTVALVRSRSDEAGVVMTPTPDIAVPPAPRALAPVAVPDGFVRVVHVAFDRVWVGTGANGAAASRLRSFDLATRELVTDTEVHGWPIALVATDGAVWVQTDAYAGDVGANGTGEGEGDDGAGSLADTTVYRIDPATGAVVTEIAQFGAGPMDAAGSRLAVADRATLTIVDDELGTVATAPIADAVGHDATDPASPSSVLAELRHGPDGLIGLSVASSPGAPGAPPHQLVTIDPETGRHRSTIVLDVTRGNIPFLAQAGRVTWLGWERELVAVTDGTAAPLRIEGGSSDLPVIEIEPFGERVVALTSTDAFVVARDTATFVTPLDPTANGAAIVQLDGQVWAAQWSDAGADPETIVSFVHVRTDPAGPPASFQVPTTEPTPPSTVVGDGVPTILVLADEPLVDGESYGVLGGGLPPGRAALSVCLRAAAEGSDPCGPIGPGPEHVVTIEDDGNLMVPWTAVRSVYDTRWHDCAVEDCVLRVSGVTADGSPTGEVLAQSLPLRFASDRPPIRPALTVAPDGPIAVGSTVTITGEHFPPGARRIAVMICRSGDHDASCLGDLASMDLTADAAGGFTTTFTIGRGSVGMPAIDPIGSPEIDCTAAPGTCSFSIFPTEGSREPYATVAVEITG